MSTTHLLTTINPALPLYYLRQDAGVLAIYLSLYGKGFNAL